MRRTILCTLALLLLLTACGKSGSGMTWQEQYDLGMRYLTEGNYAEAIIAFTAAIEIDPKQAEAYIGLADAYIGSGDYDKALEILNMGLDKTGSDERIAAKIAEVEKDRIPPFNEFGGTTFELRDRFCEFEELDEVSMNLIPVMAQAAIDNDRELMFSVMNGLSEKDYCDGYTLWNGYKVFYSMKSNWVQIELRPENGDGYLCYAGNTANATNELSDNANSWFDYYYCYDRYVANCTSWQWNGEMRADQWGHNLWKSGDGASCEDYGTGCEYGELQNGLRVGTITCQWHSTSCASYNNYETCESDSTILYNYNNGRCVSIDNREEVSKGLCSISDRVGTLNYSTDQYTLDRIYW